MSDMMRGGRYNAQCRCCNDGECDGYRTREKRQWQRDALSELQDISEMSGEYDNFDNPLIDAEYR